MRVLEIWLSAVGCPLSAGEGDGQTRFFGPILRASPSPFLGKGPNVTCFAAASYVANDVEVGDFSTPLRSTRNDIGGGKTVRRQTNMVPGNVFPTYDWPRGEGRFLDSASLRSK